MQSMKRRNFLAKSASRVALMLIVSGATGAFAEAATDTAQHGSTLQGGVEHDVSLPSLPDTFQVGQKLDPVDFEKLTPDNNWFPIPNWDAGNWHAETKTIEYMEDLDTGEHSSEQIVVPEAQDTLIGHQRDKSGQIWQFIEIPRWKKVGDPRGVAYLRAIREDVLQSDPSQIVLKILNNQMIVDRKGDKILASRQVQQIGTYVPVEDGLVKLEASLKDFDQNGNAKHLQRASTLMKRTAPYQEVDTLNGLDLKQLFEEFMKRTGRQDLLPSTM
jgi:hypothetical protein